MRQYIWIVVAVVGSLVSYFDLRERRAPDLLTLGGLALVLVVSAVEGWQELQGALIGALIGAGTIWASRVATKGGIGFGDIKFAAFLGAALQARLMLACLFSAAIFALAFAAISFKLGKFHRDKAIPFTPFLGAGALAAWGLMSLTHLAWL